MMSVEIIGPDGNVHYTRPPVDPDVFEAIRREGYFVRCPKCNQGELFDGGEGLSVQCNRCDYAAERHWERQHPDGKPDWDKDYPSAEWLNDWHDTATDIAHETGSDGSTLSQKCQFAVAFTLMIEAYSRLIGEREEERRRRILLANTVRQAQEGVEHVRATLPDDLVQVAQPIIESLEQEITRLREEIRRERQVYKAIFDPWLPDSDRDKLQQEYDAITEKICGE